MKIQKQNNNNINFTSIPVHAVNLKKVTNGIENDSVKAIFSRLDIDDPKDLDTLRQLKDTWDDRDKLVHSMYKHFKMKTPDNDYFAIELPGKDDLSERIVGLAHTLYSQTNKTYELRELITKPCLQYYTDERKIKGIGEALLGEVVKQAKGKNANNVNFVSLAKNFYNKSLERAKVNNFKLSENSFRYFISKENFDKYIQYCQDEYGDNFSAII